VKTAGRGGEGGGRQVRAAALAAVFLDGRYEDALYYRRWAHEADLVVAADGGARFLTAAGIVPDVLVGDFDSLDERAVDDAARAGAEVVRHPVRKDQTDGELAADEALRRGAGELVLAGALGALDHVLGHLALLSAVERRGVAARLVAPHLTVRVLVAPAAARLDAGPGTRVSLAALAGDAVVTLAGLEYPLSRGVLPAAACLGLGNAVAAGAAGAVTVHEGRVAVLVDGGDESFGTLRRVRMPEEPRD
jgi:thiamine pyrophosphokinase